MTDQGKDRDGNVMFMTGNGLEKVLKAIGSQRDEMVRFLSDLISVPAVGPASGGEGEMEKMELLQKKLDSFGFGDQERYDARDPNVPCGCRPNLVVGGGDGGRRTLFVVTHVDVVPPGPEDRWDGDPFKARLSEGRIFGRGTEDNGQSITSAVFAAKALKEARIEPELDVRLVFVSDEEADSVMGIRHLLGQGIFHGDHLILVPDHGTPDGRLVEISEKSIAWIKVSVHGRQCHASMPDLGSNAMRAGMRFGCLADEALHARFDRADDLFDRPRSTFEPTKKVANVSNVNTVPGEDVLYFDCRLVPPYGTADVLTVMRAVADRVQRETGTRIDLEFELDERSPEPTPPGAEIVGRTLAAVDRIYGNDPFVGGIGGGTCAAMFRHAGFHTAVWETCDNMAHSPNEYAVVDNIVGDAKVFATLFSGG